MSQDRIARPVSGPCVDTLQHPKRYSRRQITQAFEVAEQATEVLGQHHGYVCGEQGDVIGVYGDRGLLVLTEPPDRT